MQLFPRPRPNSKPLKDRLRTFPWSIFFLFQAQLKVHIELGPIKRHSHLTALPLFLLSPLHYTFSYNLVLSLHPHSSFLLRGFQANLQVENSRGLSKGQRNHLNRVPETRKKTDVCKTLPSPETHCQWKKSMPQDFTRNSMSIQVITETDISRVTMNPRLSILALNVRGVFINAWLENSLITYPKRHTFPSHCATDHIQHSCFNTSEQERILQSTEIKIHPLKYPEYQPGHDSWMDSSQPKTMYAGWRDACYKGSANFFHMACNCQRVSYWGPEP